MKKLESYENLTNEIAMEIIKEFSDYIAKPDFNPIYEFEENLPWKKDDILLSILKILKTTQDSNIKEILSNLLVFLNSIGPNPENYKKLIDTMNLGRKVLDSNGNFDNFIK